MAGDVVINAAFAVALHSQDLDYLSALFRDIAANRRDNPQVLQRRFRVSVLSFFAYVQSSRCVSSSCAMKVSIAVYYCVCSLQYRMCIALVMLVFLLRVSPTPPCWLSLAKSTVVPPRRVVFAVVMLFVCLRHDHTTMSVPISRNLSPSTVACLELSKDGSPTNPKVSFHSAVNIEIDTAIRFDIGIEIMTMPMPYLWCVATTVLVAVVMALAGHASAGGKAGDAGYGGGASAGRRGKSLVLPLFFS